MNGAIGAGGHVLTGTGPASAEMGGELGQPVALGGELAAPQSAPGAATGLPPGASNSAGSAAAGSASAGATTGAPGGPVGVGSKDAAPGAPVPGITADSILIGTVDSQSQDQVLADAGIKGGTQGSNERKANALIEVINARGGIAGRKLKLVVHKTTSSSTPESICADFTQDRRVFAVLSYGQASGEEFRACLTKKRVLFLSDHGTYFDSKDLKENPALWPVGGFNIERKIPALVDGLQAQGYFAPWDPQAAAAAPAGKPKIGLLYLEEDFNERQNPRLRAALAEHGLTFSSEFAVRNDSNSQADIKAAVLRFASNGVTHVMFNYEINAALFGLFALNASSQAYYPRYGVSSYDFPSLTKANIPDHRVFNGLKGVGWLPYTDVDKPAALGDLQKSCLKIFSDRGQQPADTNERTIMLINCDVWFKFERVASSLGPDLNVQTFMAAVPRLGAGASYAWTRVDYSRHLDGVAAVNYLEYGSDCDCIRYTRTGIPAP